ncbi:MAG: hypothetical protein GX755_00400 [Syntrophomonadaceae bacterium]|nr:hypothetical protein [Syntrophomonadaceae bacterium]
MENNFIKSFRTLAANLKITYETDCLFFTTDLNKFNFIEDNGINLPGFQVGKPFSDGGIGQKCINTKQLVVGVVPRNVYGKRLKVYAWPIINEEGKVEGTYGTAVYLFHPIGRALPLFAKPLAEAFPDGAFIMGCDREKVVVRQGSAKFDIPEYQVGTILPPDSPAQECVRTEKTITKDLDSSIFGIPIRVICIPMFDQEDGTLVATMSLYIPQTLAGILTHGLLRFFDSIDVKKIKSKKP